MKLRTLTLTSLAALSIASCRQNSTNPTNPGDGAWHFSSSGTTYSLVIGQFVNSNTGFVAGTTGVVLGSEDGGTTWSMKGNAPVFTGSVTGSIYGISFLSPTTGYAAGDQREISVTHDGGATWQSLDASALDPTQLIRSLNFRNSSVGYIGLSDAYGDRYGSIYQTMDGGQSWNSVFSTHGGIYNIDFIPGTNGMNGVAQGRYGVNYWTTDGGNTWHPGSSDQPNSLISHSTFVNSTTGFAVGVSLDDNMVGYILKSTDAGHTWTTVYTSTIGGIDAIASNGNGTITAAGSNGIIVESTDGGATWNPTVAGTNRWIDIRYASQNRAVLFGENGTIAHRDE